jgi:uncharacterized cupin superfamily protein
MGWSGCSACGICDDLLQKMGRTLLCVSIPERWRQSSLGRKHDFLRLVSLDVCEPHLGGHCHFHNRHKEASFVSLGYSCRCDRNIVDMRKVNVKDVPEQERKSPKGKFGRITKNISVALGREPESLDLSKRHPFDLALVRIPKGKFLCPYHGHAAESELYLVVSGRGNVRDKNGITEVGPGDAFLFQPGEAHQLSNAGNEDFVYYVIADNPRSGGATGDSCYYPDSGKWAVAREGSEELMVKGTETDYFDGEE